MGVYKDKLRGTYYVKYKNTTKIYKEKISKM